MTTAARHARIADAPDGARRPMPPVTLLTGSAHPALGREVAARLGLAPARCTIGRFPDGEISVCLDDPVRGREVVLFQPTCPPVDHHLVELLALADACRRAAAARIVAVVPYFGYARSDRRDGLRVPITSSLVARLLETAGVDQLLTVDAHAPALEGFFHVPVDDISAIELLADAAQARLPAGAVVVAPDLGAAKRANRFATRLGLGVAVCHKERASPTAVHVARISGDVTGRACVIVDDMIVTGSTIAECARALRSAGAAPRPFVVATHAVLADGAVAALRSVDPTALVVTDSVPAAVDRSDGLALEVLSLAPLLAAATQRLFDGGSLRQPA